MPHFFKRKDKRMQNFNEILTAIGSVGFPIVACCYMFYLYNKQIEVINDLKIVLAEIKEKIGHAD